MLKKIMLFSLVKMSFLLFLKIHFRFVNVKMKIGFEKVSYGVIFWLLVFFIENNVIKSLKKFTLRKKISYHSLKNYSSDAYRENEDDFLEKSFLNSICNFYGKKVMKLSLVELTMRTTLWASYLKFKMKNRDHLFNLYLHPKERLMKVLMSSHILTST